MKLRLPIKLVLKFCIVGVLIITHNNNAYASFVQKSIELSADVEVVADVYGNESRIRVLWISPGYGVNARHQQVAKDLGALGVQVWQTNLLEALFLPRGAQSLRKIPSKLVGELIQKISENGKYKILIVSGSYGSVPALRGAYAWQELKPKKRSLIGVVLFSPNLFAEIPALGEPPTFVDVVKVTSVPVYLFQAEKHSNRWYNPVMTKMLQKHAPVYTEIMKGVTSLFYHRDEAEATLNRLKIIAARIKTIIPLLEKHDYPLKPVQQISAQSKSTDSGVDDKIKPYRGKTKPQAFALRDVNGKLYSVSDFTGKVTVINFWATWCPPCVEEIPSLNRLREKMKNKQFQLISINYAESPKQIRDFMQQVKVDFPVLVDPEGKMAKQWRVIAFPSTFVIGPDGKIKYGVNAAIHWDTDEVINKLNKLLSQ